jgi:hypothetical protein
MAHFEVQSDRGARPRVLAPDLEPDVNCAAAVSVPVLISADADVSEWLARLIHDRSDRRNGPFTTFRPGRGDGLRLLKGVLNGAGPGRGTLFVADVGTAGADVQRWLRDALSAEQPGGARFRVMAASPSWLFNQVERGEFDAGLFYALNKVHITVGDREKTERPQASQDRRWRTSSGITSMDVAAFRQHRQMLRAAAARPQHAAPHHG